MTQIRRKRTVYSCENCRLKKIKCDRERPCSKCSRDGLKCVYITSNTFDGANGIEKKLDALKADLQFLERKKANLDADKGDARIVRFHQALVLLTLIRRNRYLAAVTKSLGELKSVPAIMKEKVEKRPREADDLKYKLAQSGMGKLHYILPYLSNPKTVFQYVDHFFDTELYASCSYVSKEKIYSLLNKYFDETGLLLTPDKMGKKEYYFLAIILSIMRISYLSYYSVENSDFIPPLVVSVEATNLAVLCLEELLYPALFVTDEVVELMIILDYCYRNSNDRDGWMYKPTRLSAFNVTQAAISIDLNIEPVDKHVLGNTKRKLWHSLIYSSYQDLIYHGYPSFIGRDEYTTKVPLLTTDNEYENLISHIFHYRESVPELLAPLTKMLTNERNPPTIREYERYADTVLLKLDDNPLDEILEEESKSKYSRTLKSAKFIDYLNMHCLCYMVYMHILLACDEDGSENVRLFKKSLKCIIRLSNPILKLFYFTGITEDGLSLRKTFGHNIEIIPTLLQTFHRVLQLQYTLLGKAAYQSRTDPNPQLEQIREVIYQNFLMIVTAFGNLGDGYNYAKKLHMVHSYFSSMVFGADGITLTDAYTKAISESGKSQLIDAELAEFILNNLVRIEGTPKMDPSSFKPVPPSGSLSAILNDPEDVILPDPLIIEKLERFLESQTFLA